MIDTDTLRVLRKWSDKWPHWKFAEPQHKALQALFAERDALEDENKTLRGRALQLAVNMVMAHEPGDSRAVSPEAVALVAVACGCDDEACWQVIDAALSKPAAVPAAGPHRYQPSIKHMGDCSVCGHVQDHPWHQQAALPAEGKGESEAREQALRDIGATPWPKLKKAIWDVVTSARINEPRYVNAYDLTDKLYAAVRATPPAPQPLEGMPTQRQMNEAFYIDVCQAEDRLREFIETGRKLLDSLPAHWHGEAESELRDLCDETSAVLNPHMHTPYQVEQAVKRYGRAALSPAPQEDGEPNWKHAFAAQSRKLQAVLHIPGVKETLAELSASPSPAAQEPQVNSPAWCAEQEKLTGTCAWCRGSGRVRTRDYHDNLTEITCHRCKGVGSVASPAAQEDDK